MPVLAGKLLKLPDYLPAFCLEIIRSHAHAPPWDDDIDIALMRDEFKKLCRVAPTEFRYSYFFQTEANDPGSLRGHAQLRNS